jgi:hypothetical protein
MESIEDDLFESWSLRRHMFRLKRYLMNIVMSDQCDRNAFMITLTLHVYRTVRNQTTNVNMLFWKEKSRKRNILWTVTITLSSKYQHSAPYHIGYELIAHSTDLFIQSHKQWSYFHINHSTSSIFIFHHFTFIILSFLETTIALYSSTSKSYCAMMT